MKIQRIALGCNFGRGVVGVDELELDEIEAGIDKYLALCKWLENRYAKTE